MAITRSPLREEVYDAIMRRLLLDEFQPGQRLSDTVLAAELGVSRTPVREALVRLEREGFLEIDVGRGFFVKPITAREIREVGPVYWTLQGLAIRSAFPLSPSVMAELDEVNDRIEEGLRTGESEETVVELNRRWHQLLIRDCTNQHLRGMISTLAKVLRRYAYAYWRDTGRVRVSVANHRAISAAFRRGALDDGLTMLERSWREGVEEAACWLDDRTTEDETVEGDE